MENIDIKPPVNSTPTAVYMLRHEDLIEFAVEIIRKYREAEAQAAEQEKEGKGEEKLQEEYLTRDEVMAITKRCGSTLTKWASAGTLKPIRLGCKYLYKKSDVIKILSYVE